MNHTLNSDWKKRKGVVPREPVSILTECSAKTSADSTKKDYVGIRWFPCANMYGGMGPVVLIVADENVHADTIEVHEEMCQMSDIYSLETFVLREGRAKQKRTQ